MPNQDKYDDVMKLLENERIKRVVAAAREEFVEQGIMNSKIKNIAKRAGVGEASVYRYFTDKNELAKLVAFLYWNEMYDVFRTELGPTLLSGISSLDKIRSFLGIFKTLLLEHPKFLVFTEDFDGYMEYVVNDQKPSNFEAKISDIKDHFLTLMKEGIENGEVRDTVDLDYIYSFVSQVMSATTQKLVSRVGYLHKELDQYSERCLDDLVDMFIHYIKKD